MEYNPKKVHRRYVIMGIAGFALILIIVTLSWLAPLIVSLDPRYGELSKRFIPPFQNPSHWLGADHLGRDILTRILYGGRVSMTVGIMSVIVSGALGVLLGITSGYFGGWFDNLIMGMADLQLTFPPLILAITLVAILGPNIINVILVLAISQWVTFARVVRSEVLSVKEREFVEADRAIGANDIYILLNSILRNVSGPIIVTGTFMFGQMIIMESSLSFLGLGVQPPIPSWGGMLKEASEYIFLFWWFPIFPGLAITLSVLGANLTREWLQYRLET